MDRLTNLLDSYVVLEKEIQKLIAPLSSHYCSACSGKCCREEICRESVESAFLAALVKRQNIEYDAQNGWLGNSGCRLEYGRPPVCYDYFCDEMLKSRLTKSSEIQAIVNDFVSIGNKAYGNIHLLCISDLDILSPQKIEKLCSRTRAMIDKMARPSPRTGALPIG